jgi:hypothetical protein
VLARDGPTCAPAVVGVSANQYEAPIAITAISIAFFINLEKNAWMAKRRRNVATAVTGNAWFADSDNLWLVPVHAARLAKRHSGCNDSEIVKRN